MSVNWECGDTAAYKNSRQYDEDSRERKNFHDLLDSMIWALLITGYPPKSEWCITEENWVEMYERLFILERVSGAYRKYTKEDEILSVYFTPYEVRSMIGLRVNAGNKTKREFDNWISKRLYERANAKLTATSKEEDWAREAS